MLVWNIRKIKDTKKRLIGKRSLINSQWNESQQKEGNYSVSFYIYPLIATKFTWQWT